MTPLQSASGAPRQPVVGTGEMADRIRQFPWAETPLGPIESWPEILLANVEMLLSTDLPMQLFWGAEMIILYNDGFAPMLTDRHPEALGQPARLFWADAWPIVGQQLGAVLTRGEAVRFHNALVPIVRNGKLQDVYWNYSYSPVYGASGEVAGILDIVHDVTESVLAAKELEESRERLKLAMEAANQATWSYDFSRQIVSGDARMAEFFGLKVLEGPAQLWLDRVHPEDRERVAHEFSATVAEGAPYHTTYRIFSGEDVRWIRAKARPLRQGDDAPLLLGIAEDITVAKQSEDALVRTEKLAAVGRLASSIAHEINNPLESVTNLLYLARHSTDLSEVQQYLDMAERELMRASSIAAQTLRFHKQSTRPQRTPAGPLLDSLITVFHGRLLNSHVRLETRFRARHSVEMLEGEIRQVLGNLIGNALDAMHAAGGGRLLIRTADAHDAAGREGVRITVGDTGSGIPASVLPRLFEAFFTTKGIGGTGLGLWVSRGIVERHKGSLRVRSRNVPPQEGTVFQLFLPCHPRIESE